MTNTEPEKRKGDGSKRFVLRGGRYSNMKVRVYPTYARWEGNRMVPERWDDLVFNGEIYVHPQVHEQDAKKPYLVYERTVT